MNSLFLKSLPPKVKIVHSDSFHQTIENYSMVLQEKNVPVIFSLAHLCLMAGVNIRSITQICNSNRTSHYKRFKLKKKRGGFRVIQTPQEELKYLQRWILVNILEKVPSHPSCKGFDKDSSIKANADVHIGARSLLKMDLQRFYDSITEKRIFGIFKSLGYHPNLAVSFAKICTIVPDEYILRSFKQKEKELKHLLIENQMGILAQGAPSSPKISNLICQNLDRRLLGLAVKYGLKYSRYADDLTFSGDYENLIKAKRIISRIVKEEKLFVNHSKTKLIKQGGKFFVTGLNVENDKTTIPRKTKKKIEHHLFHCKNNGVAKHLKTCGITNRNFKDWLLGNIAFVFSVEQDLGKKYFDDFNQIQWPI